MITAIVSSKELSHTFINAGDTTTVVDDQDTSLGYTLRGSTRMAATATADLATIVSSAVLAPATATAQGTISGSYASGFPGDGVSAQPYRGLTSLTSL